MPLKPLRRVSLAHDISAQLSQAIVAGDFPAGAVLSEPMLAKRLGVSRAPVREALIELETRGMVEFDERGRSRVPSLTSDDLVDILGVRIALEPRAASLAAHRADALAFVDLERNLDAMRTARTPTELARLDTAFHSGVVRASGSRRLLLGWNVVEHQVDLWLAQMQSRVDALCHQLRDTTVAAHTALFETIRSGDAPRAEELARKHLTDWLDVLPGAPAA
jgi:DNA-binding GntR family transcriptional regulator